MKLYHNIDIAGYTVSYTAKEGYNVVLPNGRETLSLDEISRILSFPLVYGNRGQIHALKSWAAIQAYNEPLRESEYEPLREGE
jgi:hypothetical protein